MQHRQAGARQHGQEPSGFIAALMWHKQHGCRKEAARERSTACLRLSRIGFECAQGSKRPANLSITHNFCARESAELNIAET
jgi:hypothetical protein